MPTIRQGGKLLDVTQETLQQRLERQGIPQTTQPGQAAALGATPKQADMAGVPLRKKPVLETQVAKEETLMGRQRLQEARTEATAKEQAAAERGEQIKLLGSLQDRVQGFVSGQLEGVGAEEGGEFTTALGQGLVKQKPLEVALGFTAAENPEAYQIAADILQRFSANASALEAGEQALIDLQEAGVPYIEAKNLLDLTARATGQVVAREIADVVLLRDVGVEQLGFESMDEVADLLGISAEEAGAMDMNDVAAKVQDMRQAEFNKIQGLKAELAAAPVGSLQRQVLMRQLRDLGGVGVTGLEQQVKTSAAEIDTADVVQIGDFEFEVGELLDDEELSDMIQDWLVSDEDERERMLPAAEFEGLTKWLTANEAALKEVAGDIEETTAQFTATQDDYANMPNLAEGISMGGEVFSIYMDGYDPNELVTTKDLAEKKMAFEMTGLGTLAANPSADNTQLVDKITKVTDTAVHEDLADMSAEDITTASHAGDSLTKSSYKDPFAKYLEKLGVSHSSGFVLEPSQQATVALYEPLFQSLETAGGLGWLNNTDFDELTLDEKKQMADLGTAGQEKFDQFREWKDKQRKVAAATNVDDVLKLLGIDDPTGKYDEAKELANLGVQAAREFVDKIDRLRDVNTIKAGMDSKVSVDFAKFMSEGIKDFDKENYDYDPVATMNEFKTGKQAEYNRTLNTVRDNFKRDMDSIIYSQSFYENRDKFSINELETMLADSRNALRSVWANMSNSVPTEKFMQDIRRDTVSSYSTEAWHAHQKVKDILTEMIDQRQGPMTIWRAKLKLRQEERARWEAGPHPVPPYLREENDPAPPY